MLLALSSAHPVSDAEDWLTRDRRPDCDSPLDELWGRAVACDLHSDWPTLAEAGAEVGARVFLEGQLPGRGLVAAAVRKQGAAEQGFLQERPACFTGLFN